MPAVELHWKAGGGTKVEIEANTRLAGPPPRAEWADCYKLA